MIASGALTSHDAKLSFYVNGGRPAESKGGSSLSGQPRRYRKGDNIIRFRQKGNAYSPMPTSEQRVVRVNLLISCSDCQGASGGKPVTSSPEVGIGPSHPRPFTSRTNPACKPGHEHYRTLYRNQRLSPNQLPEARTSAGQYVPIVAVHLCCFRDNRRIRLLHQTKNQKLSKRRRSPVYSTSHINLANPD